MRSASTEGRGDWAFKSGSIVDRETYTKFMELELEKVSSAFMQVKNLPERIEQLQNQIVLNQEKVNNLTRIVSVVQESESSHESDIRDIKSALKQMGVKSDIVKERK